MRKQLFDQKTLRCSECGLTAKLDAGSGRYYPTHGDHPPIFDGKCPRCDRIMQHPRKDQ
jgi:hypothetical protein